VGAKKKKVGITTLIGNKNCFLRYSENYANAVIRGANTNGDSDSIACIAGSISGAYLGIEAIPLEWIRMIEKTQYLEDLAKRLAARKRV